MANEKRLIDANALIDTLAVVAKKMAKSDAQKALMGRVLYIIEHKPTVDAVEVVRCEVCQSHELCEVRGKVWCGKLHRYMKEGGFCSEGVQGNV